MWHLQSSIKFSYFIWRERGGERERAKSDSWGAQVKFRTFVWLLHSQTCCVVFYLGLQEIFHRHQQSCSLNRFCTHCLLHLFQFPIYNWVVFVASAIIIMAFPFARADEEGASNKSLYFHVWVFATTKNSLPLDNSFHYCPQRFVLLEQLMISKFLVQSFTVCLSLLFCTISR